MFKKGFSRGGLQKSYRSRVETSVRGFVKACLSDTNRYGIPEGLFASYKDLIAFVYEFVSPQDVKLTPSTLSNLKHRKTISRTVPRTPENDAFINSVKKTIPSFEDEAFFRELSSEGRKQARAELKVLTKTM